MKNFAFFLSACLLPGSLFCMETQAVSPKNRKNNRSVSFSSLVETKSFNSNGETSVSISPLAQENPAGSRPLPTIAYYTIGALCASVFGIIIKTSANLKN